MLAQGQTSITGRVTTATGEPLAEARVQVVSTSLAVVTNTDGRYALRGVPSGSVEIRVIRVGYVEQKKAVSVASGATASLDFTMETAVVKLQEIVTTATGDQRRVELGNSVATLGDVNQKVETTPITDFQDLMVAKTAGVQVLPGNMTGAAPQIRIRGLSSISLSNAPIYVIDGIRMNSANIGLGTGGTNGSFLNDLDPNEIEDVEIVKGPSAATLYGTDAANGVVVITTKKGHSGTTRWTYYAEGGGVSDRNTYPTDYATWGHNAKGILRCTLVSEAAGSCTADSVTSYNVLMNPSTTPNRLGQDNNYGMNASGGSDQVRFFLSGGYKNEIGPVHMPTFAQATLDSLGQPARDEWLNPEAFQSYDARVNLNASVSPTFDFSGNAGFSNTNQRLPQVDNNIYSYLYSAQNNPGFNHNSTASGLTYNEIGSLGEFKNGYGGFSPAQIFQQYNSNNTQRFIGSGDANWRPFDWMQNQGTMGVDLADNNFGAICRLNECPNSGTLRLGSVSQTQTNNRNFSAKLVSNSTWQARSNLNMKTTLGADYVNLESDGVNSSGVNLPPGAQTVGSAATKNGGNTLQTVNKTLGVYIQEQASFRDRLFLTGAVRTDQNSSFGTKFERVAYPKAQVSWIISDESFFPHPDWLNQLRLRSAYGAAGVQPTGTQALQTFTPSTVNLIAATPGGAAGGDTPGLLANALGNPNLQPEKSAELELGFESGLMNNRVHFDFTYYNKKTHNAIVNEPIAASSGAPALTLIANLASVQNSGLEANLNMTLIDRRALGWDVTVAASHNSNKVLSLGFDATGKPIPTIGTGSNRDSVGFPIQGWFVRPFTYKDANGDGIISPSEVTIDSTAYYGYAVPRDIVSITNGFDLFHRVLRLTVLTDYKGGFDLFN
ncbi:MAG TPA: SusC/RagA family TonB-linked outer membrane protein, partial [Gemmatimonadaceae bacterium]|nr:SusC/RagA family TonB-linked outer membrane protein [Gemmatimonadaceae bacterium]